MKIGIFTESFLPQVNGVVTSICNSAGVLSKRHDVSIFTVGSGPRKAAGCTVHRFRGMKLPTYPDYRFFVPSRSVWRRLSRERLDIVHVRSSVGFGVVALRFARKRGIPLVGTFDTPISDYVHYVPLFGKIRQAEKALSNTALKYTAWFYNKCDAVIAPSNAAADWLRDAGCSGNIVTLSNGVDTKKFGPEARDRGVRVALSPNNEVVLLHVGRMSGEKRVDVLLEAAKEMKKWGMKFRMVMVGKGPALASLKRRANALGIGECVCFAGFVPDEELPKYYASADIFVTASPVETEGIVMLEAMASGLPVIGANAGAIPEIVDGTNGMLFAPGRPKELAESVSGLMDTRKRRRMSANALRSSNAYSIASTAKKLEGIYTGLVNKPGAGIGMDEKH